MKYLLTILLIIPIACFGQKEMKESMRDTVEVVMFVCDTTTWKAWPQPGYEVRFWPVGYNNMMPPFLPHTYTEYLDKDKKYLPKNVVVLISK